MNEATIDPVRLLHQDLLINHPIDAVRYLEKLAPEQVAEVLANQTRELTLNVWERMSQDVSVRALAQLDDEAVAGILRDIDANRAAAILAATDTERRELLLAKLDAATADDLRVILSYPADSAGAMMDPRMVLCREDTTVGEALERIRATRRRAMRLVFLVDDDNRPIGIVDIQDMATTSSTDTPLAELRRPLRAAVNALASREEVVETLDQYRLTDLAVVDLEGRIVGVVRYRNLVAAAEDEATAAMQTMVGVSKDERALSKVLFTVKKRLPWLHINLATAFVAAAVVGVFEATIAQYTALAVLLPIVAGQSGNTGAQALAVTMRGLALREIRSRHWPRVLFKELSAGFWNGLAIALTTSIGVWLWSRSLGLSLVIGVSMVLSMVIAGVSGAAIPILLTTMGQDPAQSSSIVLTTVTDVAGFFSFLGIATILLAYL